MRPIEEIAREAGFMAHVFMPSNPPKPAAWYMEPEHLARFAAIVRAEALEEAARACDARCDFAHGRLIRALKDAPHA